jgi:ABC-type transporter Mla subunit MlaD
MKCNLNIICTFFFLLSSSLYAQQDVKPNQLLLILEILNESGQITNSLEASTKASNQTIQGLSLKVNSMQTTIDAQQRQLKRASENSSEREQKISTLSDNYEQTLQSVQTSLTELSLESQEKDGKILKLTETNAAQMKAIFIMGGVLAAIAAYLIVRLILWIKGGAAVSLLKSVAGRLRL